MPSSPPAQSGHTHVCVSHLNFHGQPRRADAGTRHAARSTQSRRQESVAQPCARKQERASQQGPLHQKFPSGGPPTDFASAPEPAERRAPSRTFLSQHNHGRTDGSTASCNVPTFSCALLRSMATITILAPHAPCPAQHPWLPDASPVTASLRNMMRQKRGEGDTGRRDGSRKLQHKVQSISN